MIDFGEDYRERQAMDRLNRANMILPKIEIRKPIVKQDLNTEYYFNPEGSITFASTYQQISCTFIDTSFTKKYKRLGQE